jgi:hypothetical protein
MKLICLLAFIGCSSQLISQTCQNLVGTWSNELGSALVIDQVMDNGNLIGHYASSTGVDGKIFPLQGWLNKNEEHPDEINISFTVRWEGYGSITSWTGYCHVLDGMPQIKTIWNLVRSGKQFDWERIITNSSIFKAAGQE